MKYDVKKELKQIFATKTKPNELFLPELRYLTIRGKGNPNSSERFAKCVQALYSVMYTAKFAYKKDASNKRWDDFTVPPLVGWWTISDEAIKRRNFTKDDFEYELRLLIPFFVTDNLVQESIKIAKAKKGFTEIDEVAIKQFPEMHVGQILHIGSYDNEPASFEKLETFLQEQQLTRKSKSHVEIYLSDSRKTAPEKLKTILQVEL